MSQLTHTTGRAATWPARRQEEVMGKAIPTQHPAVVLRSHYTLVRAMLAIAMIAVVGLTIAVVVMAVDGDEVSSTSSADAGSLVQPAGQAPPAAGTRYDGGPEEGSRGIVQAPRPGVRYDGGPEEGTRGALSFSQQASPPSGIRYDGGPEEGVLGTVPAPSSSGTRYDGGPEEGSRGTGH
jgi:hypothetical protein